MQFDYELTVFRMHLKDTYRGNLHLSVGFWYHMPTVVKEESSICYGGGGGGGGGGMFINWSPL